jgi:Mg2+ and Co2+ transporter CorA
MGSLFLVPTFIAGYFGMNLIEIQEPTEKLLLLTGVFINFLLIGGGLWWALNSFTKEHKVRPGYS